MSFLLYFVLFYRILHFYMAEYAYTMRVTKSGNIFSFGTILLELLTGKQAVNEGIVLVKWVKDKIEHDHLDEILDPR